MTTALSDPLNAGGLLVSLAGRAAPDAPATAAPGADFGRMLDTLTDAGDPPPEQGDDQKPGPPSVSSQTFLFHLLTLDAPHDAAEAPAAAAEISPLAASDPGSAASDAPATVALRPDEKNEEPRNPEAASPRAAPDNAPVAFQAAFTPPPAGPLPPSPQPPATDARALATIGLMPPASVSMPFAQPAAPASNASVVQKSEGVDTAAGEENPSAAAELRPARLPAAIAFASRTKAPASRRDELVVAEERRSPPPLAPADDASRARLAPSLAGNVSTPTPAPEPPLPSPIQIRVSEIVTHLPAVVAQALIAPSGEEAAGGSAAPMAGPVIAPPTEKPAEPLKILRFQVEPASLGAITVRMRVTHARVEIALDADSPRTSALLLEARDQLTSAIGEKGMTLDSFRVGLNPPAGALPAGQEGGGADDRQAPYGGGRGFANDERPDQRQKSQTPARDRQRRHEKPVSTGPLGVIL